MLIILIMVTLLQAHTSVKLYQIAHFNICGLLYVS